MWHLGWNNVTDDQRAAIEHSVAKRRKVINQRERANKAGEIGGRDHLKKASLLDDAAGKLTESSHDRAKESRRAAAKEAGREPMDRDTLYRPVTRIENSFTVTV